MKLTDPFYDAVVISDEVDPNHAGAVRAKILGVTDDFEDEFQPFVFPIVDRMQAVPTKGTFMVVQFEDGDINKGRYFHTSPEKNFLPDDYVADYPNVAVCNLGGDFFHMIHNRRTRTTEITHPSNSKITWTASGALIHDSDKGYINAGYGAINTQGTKIHSVLTEATIDPFTCTPYGNNIANGGAYQGSEYLFVTHMSKAMADAINGSATDDFQTEADKSPSKEVGGAELVTNDIYDANGETVDKVAFYPIESYIEVENKEPRYILIVNSGNMDFVGTASKMVDTDNDYSVHYLIGRTGDTPPIDSERTATENEKASGFIQFIDIKNDAHYGSDKVMQNKLDTPANTGAVIVMLVGTGTGYTDYQYQMVNKLIQHVRYVFDNKSINIAVPDQFLKSGIGSDESIGNLDNTKLVR